MSASGEERTWLILSRVRKSLASKIQRRVGYPECSVSSCKSLQSEGGAIDVEFVGDDGRDECDCLRVEAVEDGDHRAQRGHTPLQRTGTRSIIALWSNPGWEFSRQEKDPRAERLLVADDRRCHGPDPDVVQHQLTTRLNGRDRCKLRHAAHYGGISDCDPLVVHRRFVMMGAKVGELYGPTSVFRATAGLFGVAMATMAASPTATVVILAQGIAGTAAAALVPTLVVLTTTTYDGRQQVKAFGSLGAAEAAASVPVFTLTCA